MSELQRLQILKLYSDELQVGDVIELRSNRKAIRVIELTSIKGYHLVPGSGYIRRAYGFDLFTGKPVPVILSGWCLPLITFRGVKQ